jgi:NADPH-dependent ferric siderophore reductase
VTRNRRISPHATRVTFTGPDLSELVMSAPDQRVKLFVPARGTTAPPIAPMAATARDALAPIPEADRPHPRTYTIRAFRGDRPELDIDFALRDPGGPASRWARSAQPGQSLEMLGPITALNRGFLFRPPPGRDVLLVGDQSALPAIGAILESLPSDARGQAFVTVPSPADRQLIAKPDQLRITWLQEGDHAGLLAAVRAADFGRGEGADADPIKAARAARSPEVPYAWLAGEAAMVAAQRRHLLDERGLTPKDIASMAYWRTEHTEATAHRPGLELRAQATLSATRPEPAAARPEPAITSAAVAGVRPLPTRRAVAAGNAARRTDPRPIDPRPDPELRPRPGLRSGGQSRDQAWEKSLTF